MLASVSNGSANSMVYFAYNAQGDVIGLYGYNGTLYATYDYDAWGNCTVTPLVADTAGHSITDANHIAHINPFRYRGYYYDTETGLYYLNSRYYDPQTGRFLNADSYIFLSSITACNLFAYCYNNPINYVDNSGCSAEALFVAAVGAAAVDGPLPFGDIVAVGLIAAGLIMTAVTTQQRLEQVVVIIPPSMQNNNNKPDKEPNKKPSVRPKPILPIPSHTETQNDKDGKRTYYHATSAENAAMITASGQLMGSTWEGGYVYAWRTLPSKRALELSGAHSGTVVISFQTYSKFIDDPGITDPYVKSFGPVQSALGRPVGVYNVKLAARY